MNKSQRTKQKRLIRHKARRKNKSQNNNPFEAAAKEHDKQILKSVKIKIGKMAKKEKHEDNI